MTTKKSCGQRGQKISDRRKHFDGGSGATVAEAKEIKNNDIRRSYLVPRDSSSSADDGCFRHTLGTKVAPNGTLQTISDGTAFNVVVYFSRYLLRSSLPGETRARSVRVYLSVERA